LHTVDPGWIYLILICFSFLENIFPPLPSDVVVIVGATLIASSTAGFIQIIWLTALASALGFMVMYLVGKYLGERILRTGRIKFISPSVIQKSDRWFARYGYQLIIANRFLPGTRSIISFFSGLSELPPVKTFFCAALSALFWNTLIIYLGRVLGNNLELIDRYLSTYRNIILVFMGVLVSCLIARYWFIRRKRTR
jgi:membrane protein DedA with SNARE-associated domain